MPSALIADKNPYFLNAHWLGENRSKGFLFVPAAWAAG
jgi:hypothetical protein